MKRLRIILLALVLTLIPMQSSLQFVHAEGQAAIQHDVPSSWAIEDVNMLRIYNFIDSTMYGEYQKGITKDELYTIGVSLYEKLTSSEVKPADATFYDDITNPAILKAYTLSLLSNDVAFEPDQPVTRLDVVTMLFQVIRKAQPGFDFYVDGDLNFKDSAEIPEADLNAVKYLVSKGLLKGKADQTLNLSAHCSHEELFAFVNRTYNFVIQETKAAAQGMFWKVDGGKSNVYLLGSIHVADSSIYPMNNDIVDAYNSADYLVVEANVLTSNMEEIAYMQEKMFYADDNTLDKNISEETYKQYAEEMEQLGIVADVYNKLKPWSAALTLQNLKMAQSSYTGTLGVDLYFMLKAYENKEMIEIEGIRFQTDLFDSFSPELQEQFLQGVLAGTEEAGEEDVEAQMEILASMLAAWKEGNVSELEALVNTESLNEESEFDQKFWIERNNHMVEETLTYLADENEKTYFVIVGAGHMIGDTGIVKQLRDKGYTVEQILD